MSANFDSAFAKLMELEGGMSDHPSDSGGATYAGITRKRWDKWLRERFPTGYQWPPTDAQVRTFYYEVWWEAQDLDELPGPVATELFKSAVNMGIFEASKILQLAVRAATGRKLAVDGVIGPATKGALSDANAFAVAAAMKSETARFYDKLVAAKPEYKVFHRGWIERAYA